MFGTAHNIPISYLPESVVNFILSHDVLVTEADRDKKVTSDKLRQVGFLLEEADTSPLSLFSVEDQENIKSKLEKYFSINERFQDLVVDELNIKGLNEFYEQSCYLGGIDFSISDYFKSNNKIIKGLEVLTESFVFEPEEDENTITRNLRELIEEDNFSEPWKKFCEVMRYKSYFINLIQSEDMLDATSVCERNSNWIPKIKEMNSSHIICVGYFHLYKSWGLLSRLKNLGYSIMQMCENEEFIPIESDQLGNASKKISKEEYKNLIKSAFYELSPDYQEELKTNPPGFYEDLMGESPTLDNA